MWVPNHRVAVIDVGSNSGRVVVLEVGHRDHLDVLADSRARAIITTAALWAPLRERRGRFPFLRHVLIVGGGASQAGEHDFAALVDSAPTHLEAAPTSSDDAAFWLQSDRDNHALACFLRNLFGRRSPPLGVNRKHFPRHRRFLEKAFDEVFGPERGGEETGVGTL